MWRPRLVLESWWVFALGLLLGARLRWLHVVTLRRTPFFSTLVGDSAAYDAWARSDWFGGSTPYFVDPLYPTLLGLVYRLAGRDLLLVRGLHVAISVGTAVLVGLLAWKLAGPLARNLAVFMWAQLKPDIFNTAEIDKTVLGLGLTAAALWLVVDTQSWWKRVAAGACFGLAVLTRGNLLLAALVPVGFFLAERRWRDAVGFVVAGLLVICPVTIRNVVVSGEWVFTTTGLGPNLYLGNNPFATTGGYDALPFVRANAQFEARDFQAAAERRVGSKLTASQASAFWRDEARAFIVAHPWLTTKRVAYKLWLVFNDFEVGDAIELDSLARFAPVLRLPLLGLGLVVPLALLGAVVGWRRRETRMISVFCVVLATSIAAFFVLARFRAFLLPAVAVLAAVGLCWVIEGVIARRWRAVGGAVVLVIAAGVGCTWPPELKRLSKVVGPLNAALVFEAAGDVQTARLLMTEAQAAAPGDAAPACSLAHLEVQSGNWPAARANLQRCLAGAPLRADSWALLGRLEAHEKHASEAREAYRRALELRPDDEALRDESQRGE